ncbi:MAG: LysR family transcriptional regulator, partial [Gammaproteobacteria bacterium]|nr:LysR family transcriptional regulator [Gammaproteobacteria bacterium]
MKTSLEQWIAFQAVVDQGSYAQAAAHLHKSQSTLSYAITRLEEQLGLELLKVEGRKAQLTPIGEVLLAHSRHLTAEVQQIEQLAKNLSSGWEHEIRLVADAACPVNYLMDVLRIFARDCPQSRIRLTEVVMSGGAELIHEGKADLAITAFVPSGLLADKLFDVEFIAVAHHEHPLNQFDRAL